MDNNVIKIKPDLNNFLKEELQGGESSNVSHGNDDEFKEKRYLRILLEHVLEKGEIQIVLPENKRMGAINNNSELENLILSFTEDQKALEAFLSLIMKEKEMTKRTVLDTAQKVKYDILSTLSSNAIEEWYDVEFIEETAITEIYRIFETLVTTCQSESFSESSVELLLQNIKQAKKIEAFMEDKYFVIKGIYILLAMEQKNIATGILNFLISEGISITLKDCLEHFDNNVDDTPFFEEYFSE